jgi:hypothetical protein
MGVELDGSEERVLRPCLRKGAREQSVTALKADPAGKIQIEAVQRNGSGLGARRSLGTATLNQPARELSRRRQIR